LNDIIIKAATESLGKRRIYKDGGLRLWDDEIAQYTKEKEKLT
jgi:hypothetical protein